MGSCYYNLKAQFKTKAEAEKARKALQLFLIQNDEATENRKLNSEEVFKAYPLVKEYLQIIKGSWEDDSQYYGSGIEDDLRCWGNILVFSSEVSHMCSWENLKTYIQTKYNPIRVVWCSEEEGGTLDSLNLYEWEEIVQAILKHKKTLPFLLGIHKDFDELISIALRKRGKA